MGTKLKNIRIGTGGMPITSRGGNTTYALKRLAELDLQHLELEFVQNVYLKEEQARELKIAAEENEISLTVHGSYFTNLAAIEPQKWHASIARLIKAAEIGDAAGAVSITFHAAFFTGQTEPVVRKKILEALKTADDSIRGLKICLAPELTGKKSQFGSLPELISLVKDAQQVGLKDRIKFCVDFAHNHARNNGTFITKGEYREFFDTIVNKLGSEYLQELHMHISGIEYSEKGEKNHLTFLSSLDEYKDNGIEIPGTEGDFEAAHAKNRAGGSKQDWQALLQVLVEYEVSGYLVCESPVLELDACLLRQYYKRL